MKKYKAAHIIILTGNTPNAPDGRAHVASDVRSETVTQQMHARHADVVLLLQ